MTQSGIKPQLACSAVLTNCATVCSTVHDNVARIKFSVMSRSKVFV